MEEHDHHVAGRDEPLVNEHLPTETYYQLSDTKLWDLFRTGDKQAFDIIYDLLFNTLCRYGDKICAEKVLVEDVIQDLFIHLWTTRARLGATDSIKFYLFRSLRRMLIRRMQQESNRNNTYSSSANLTFQLALAEKNPSSRISEEEDERKVLLTHALKKLTDRQREAIYLKFYNNLSFQEVAEVMEIEVRSVYNLISRTIDVLRADFQIKKSNGEAISSTAILMMFIPYLENF